MIILIKRFSGIINSIVFESIQYKYVAVSSGATSTLFVDNTSSCTDPIHPISIRESVFVRIIAPARSTFRTAAYETLTAL